MLTSTKITTYRIENALRSWLLFGEPVEVERTESRSVYWFEADRFVGVSRQTLNGFGIVRWEMWLVRTVGSGERCQTIPGVDPGAEVLAYTSGKAHAKAVQEYVGLLGDYGLKAGRVGELHRRAAPVLQIGEVPVGIVERYAEARRGRGRRG